MSSQAVSSKVETWKRILRTCGPPETAALDAIGRWLLVTRACVQPMTLTAGAVAGLLAAGHPDFHLGYLALALLGLVLAHAANNMINDYFDHSAGQDTDAYPRSLYAPHPVNSGIVTRRELGRAILIANALDGAIMVSLGLARGWPIVAIALGGLFISVFYVAPPLRFKARGLGEPSVALIWGPLMVGGTYLAATGDLPARIMIASIPYALLVATVLFGKHIDKMPWDGPQGIRTLPVIVGHDPALSITRVLMSAFYVLTILLVIAGIYPAWCLICLAAFPSLRRALATYGQPKPSEPPPGYPLWPLWFGPWAFVHARRAGALLVMGLALGAVWPI